MVRMGLLTLVLLAGSDWVEPSFPPITSATYQLPGCKAKLQDFKEGICAGAIWGIGFVINDSPDPQACAHIPKRVTLADEVEVVVRYIEARPERLDQSFRQLAVEALADAWPCGDEGIGHH
jgi:Rap1a immunity proteins